MNLPVNVSKHEVAMQHLDRAIELYLRGDSYYSALHLGGAAEEILNVYARDIWVTQTETLKPAFDQFKEAVLVLAAPSEEERAETEKWIHDRMTKPRNSVKHKRGGGDNDVCIDAKEEAYDVIDRAISTYVQLLSHLKFPWLSSIKEFDAASLNR